MPLGSENEKLQHFRDRFQVDLIDMRSCAMEDVYGNTMNWILTLKDHFTHLTYLYHFPGNELESRKNEVRDKTDRNRNAKTTQNERTSRTSSILGQLKGCVRVPLSGAPADHTKVMPSPKLATAPP
eukprot:scaffold12485_cov137-Skeletonema_menzelii.AAC.2